MSDAPSKHAVESATLVLVEMLRSPEASKAFAKSQGDNGVKSVISAHQHLVEHFQQFPDHDPGLVLSRHKALSS